jgi:hypothetical protein
LSLSCSGVTYASSVELSLWVSSVVGVSEIINGDKRLNPHLRVLNMLCSGGWEIRRQKVPSTIMTYILM